MIALGALIVMAALTLLLYGAWAGRPWWLLRVAAVREDERHD